MVGNTLDECFSEWTEGCTSSVLSFLLGEEPDANGHNCRKLLNGDDD